MELCPTFPLFHFSTFPKGGANLRTAALDLGAAVLV